MALILLAGYVKIICLRSDTRLMTLKFSKSTIVIETDTYDALHHFARKRFGADVAADLVHEACLRFLQVENKDTIREPRAFLFRIVANLGIDFWRKEKNRNQRKMDYEDLNFDAFKSNHPGPEACMMATLQVEALLDALAEMPETHRHAFVLNKFEGLTHAAIAKRFGMQEKTVQRQIAVVVAHCAERLGYQE